MIHDLHHIKAILLRFGVRRIEDGPFLFFILFISDMTDYQIIFMKNMIERHSKCWSLICLQVISKEYMIPEDTPDTNDQFKSKLHSVRSRPRVFPNADQQIISNLRPWRIWNRGVFPIHITKPNPNQGKRVKELQSFPYLLAMRIMMAQYFEV